MSLRRIRCEYENAGGDNLLAMNPKNSENRGKREIEEESKEPRYLNGLLGGKQLAITSLVLVCIYLVNGAYAKLLCTALTSFPPAVFSFRALINEEARQQDYHTIILYWTLYGFISLFDQFAGTAQGYNLCKFGLLTAVFFQAVRSCSSTLPASWKFWLEHTSAEKVNVVRTPTMTHFSEDDNDSLQYVFASDTKTKNGETGVSTARDVGSTLGMQSTQSASFLGTMNVEGIAGAGSLSAKAVTSAGNNDLVTVPKDHIEFSSNNRERVIRLTNISPLNIMFTLKTNTDAHLVAAPTSGVLFKGQSKGIRVGVSESYFDDCSDPGVSIDKLAIDYVLIPESSSSLYQSFTARFFHSQNRRRLAIRVFYR